MAAPAFQAAGTVVRGAGAVAPAWPTHVANDIGVLFVESANQAVTAPAGWTEFTNSPQGTGTAGTSGATRLSAFWKRAASAAETAPTVADSGDHQIAVIVTVRGCIATGDPTNITAGNVAAAATTAFSIPTATTTVDECLVLLAVTNNGTVDTTQVTAAPTNAALTSIVKRVDSQPVLPDVGETMLRVGPYTGMTDVVGVGPGGDTGAPYYRVAGINPHQMSAAELQAAIDTADDLDITIFATTNDSPASYGANTATGFDIVRYKAKVDTLAAIANFKDAVQRGRIVCLIGDEPQHSKWDNSSGQNTWSPTVVNDCGRYHKQQFGVGTITVMRQDCHRLRVGWDGAAAPASYDGLDYGIMQYEGPNAQADQTFEEAYEADLADGAAVNVGCIPALNLWGGGNHTTVDGVPGCWDYLNTGTSSGVIAGSVQGTPSPYSRGQQLECATWTATPSAGQKTLVASPAWIRRVADVCAARSDAPWLLYWMYAVPTISDFSYAGPLQIRPDMVTSLDYSVNKGLARSAADGLRTIKVYP